MSKSLEDQLNAAIGAAEDGGANPLAPSAAKAKPVEKKVVQQEVKPEPVPAPKVEPKVQEQVVEAPKKEIPRAPQPTFSQSKINSGLDLNGIKLVIDLYDKFNEKDEVIRQTIANFVGAEADDVAKVIEGTLKVEPSMIKSLEHITNAYSKDSAARAFYLVAMEIPELNGVSHLLSRLIDTDSKTISASNKIEACQDLEYIISNIPQESIAIVEELKDYLKVREK